MKSLALFALMGALLLAGCSSETTQSATTATETPEVSATTTSTPEETVVEEETAEEASSGERILIDDLGIAVTIPENPSRIVIADLPPLVHTYYVVNGSSDGLVGVDADNSILNTLLPTVFPDLVDLESGFSSTGTTNIEELLSLEPDLILYRADDPEGAAVIQATGVPAVAFQTFNRDNGNTITPVQSWVSFMSFILDVEEDTEEYTRRAFESIGFIQSRMWDVEDITTSAYMNFSSESMTIAGDGLFGGFTSSIINTEDLGVAIGKGSSVLSVEELYALNPDIIFLSVGSLPAADVLAMPELAELDAVKNGRVYLAPLGIFTWYGPSLDVPVALMWHAKLAYPQYFADVDVVALTREHYAETYNYTLTDSDIEYLFANSLELLYAES